MHVNNLADFYEAAATGDEGKEPIVTSAETRDDFIMDTRHTRFKMCDALEKHLIKQRFDYSITAVFNKERSIDFLKQKVGEWHNRMDRLIVGSKHTNKPNTRRIFFVGAIEHPDTNIHAHLMLRLPDYNGHMLFKNFANAMWKDINGDAANIKLRRVRNQRGKVRAVEYMTKDMWQREAFNNFIISTEYSSN